MKILAYDSSGSVLSAALFDGDKRLSEVSSDTGARHSSALLPMIEKLLKKHSWKMDKVQVVAVCLGPGSFTGLRVGVTMAKIFGYALKKKLVGVSGLEVMAWHALSEDQADLPAGRQVAVSLDARRGQLYGAAYEKKAGELKTLLKPCLISPEEFAKKTVGMTRLDGGLPSASGVGAAALSLIRKKKFIDPFKLEPLYLRGRDCNVTLPKK